MRYHINSKGEVGLCRATHSCPFGDLEEGHYSSPEEARAAYEHEQAPQLFEPLPMKKLHREGLMKAILHEAALPAPALARLEKAMHLADFLHEGQIRKALIQGRANTPYIEHPLRNTLRLIRWGVTDAEVLEANLLHDTVEDCSLRFAANHGDSTSDEASAREQLSLHIATAFSPRTARLVAGVTNPLVDEDEWRRLSPEERREAYRAHVMPALHSSPAVFLVKLSDFIDNAGSLHHATPEERKGARRLARKYYPLIDDIEEAHARHHEELPLSEAVHEQIRGKLKRLRARLDSILEEA